MTEKTTPLSVFQSWLGTKEVPGAKANPLIAGKPWSWFSLVEYPEIESDEIANCAAGVGASIVWSALVNAGLTKEDLEAEEAKRAVGVKPRSAIEMLRDKGVLVVLPPRNDRLLARSYCTYGIDATNDPKPGDICVIPRGAKWQGHVMMIVSVDKALGVAKCIGANQSDRTSYATHDLKEFIAIRRPVAATVKDLRMAGSNAVKRNDMLQNVGLGGTVGSITAGVAKTAADAPAPVVETVTNAAPTLQQTAEHLTMTQTITDASVAIGKSVVSFGGVFVQNPWLIGVLILGGVAIYIGRNGNAKRVLQHALGVPLSSQSQPA